MKLSIELSKWRCDRPDEWKMDEFIRNAEKLQAERDAFAAQVSQFAERIKYLERLAWNSMTEVDSLKAALGNLRRAVFVAHGKIPKCQARDDLIIAFNLTPEQCLAAHDAEVAKAAIYALFEVGNCPQLENSAGDGYIECGDALKFAEQYSAQLHTKK